MWRIKIFKDKTKTVNEVITRKWMIDGARYFNRLLKVALCPKALFLERPVITKRIELD